MVTSGEALLRGCMWATCRRHACHEQRVRSLLGLCFWPSAQPLAHYSAWYGFAQLLFLPQAGIVGMPCGGTNVYTSCRIERPKVQLTSTIDMPCHLLVVALYLITNKGCLPRVD